jgi:hypothetical protein
MEDLLDRVLEADSQQDALERFEDDAVEPPEEVSDAVEALKDGLCDATAGLVLPEK